MQVCYTHTIMLCTYNCVIHMQLCYTLLTALCCLSSFVLPWLPDTAPYSFSIACQCILLWVGNVISSCVIYVNLSLLSKNVYRDGFFLFSDLFYYCLILPLEFNLEYKMSIVMLIRRIHLKSQRRSLRATNPISAIKMLKVRLKSRNLELNLQNSKFKLEFAAFKILRRKSIITAFKTGLLSLRTLS